MVTKKISNDSSIMLVCTKLVERNIRISLDQSNLGFWMKVLKLRIGLITRIQYSETMIESYDHTYYSQKYMFILAFWDLIYLVFLNYKLTVTLTVASSLIEIWVHISRFWAERSQFTIFSATFVIPSQVRQDIFLFRNKH